MAGMPKKESHLIPWRKVLPAPALCNKVDACCGVCCEDNIARAACVYKLCDLSPGILVPSRGLHIGKYGTCKMWTAALQGARSIGPEALPGALVRALQRIEALVQASDMR